MNKPTLFDSAALRRHIARAQPHIAAHDALLRDTADQLIERLAEVKQTFPAALDLSPFPFLPPTTNTTHAPDALWSDSPLPFAPHSFDLIASNLALHWVDDVPGMLAQIRACLKPGGLFIAALIGGHSLHELRACLLDAELAISGGVSPRLSPTIDLLTASQLLQRAGFTLPVADKETVTLVYGDMFALMRDLRGMGQSNAHAGRMRHFTRRAIFTEAQRLYRQRFADVQGRIPATFDIIYLHGWAALTQF